MKSSAQICPPITVALRFESRLFVDYRILFAVMLGLFGLLFGVRSGEHFLPPNPRLTESYPAPDPGAGAGLSGAPPTETGPTGLGSRGVFFRDAPMTRARAFECGMLEVVITAFCRASACAASEESWRDILFKSACWVAELCESDTSTAACCCCDD